MIRAGQVWSDERAERVRVLYEAGLSASQIAVDLGEGVTRNAVCGKIMRMKLPHRGFYYGPKPKDEKKPPKSERKSTTRARPSNGARRVIPIMENIEQIKLRCVEIEPLNILLLDLEPHHCRYPAGEGASITFCGHPKREASSYCMPHHALAQHRPMNISDAEHERRRRHFKSLIGKPSARAMGVPA